jgi:hypothetical protein
MPGADDRPTKLGAAESDARPAGAFDVDPVLALETVVGRVDRGRGDRELGGDLLRPSIRRDGQCIVISDGIRASLDLVVDRLERLPNCVLRVMKDAIAACDGVVVREVHATQR